MAITTLLDPTLLPARTMDQAAFDAAMAYLMTNLPAWGSQANALAANLNRIAAGGAYAIPYTFSDAGSVMAGGSGYVAVNDYTAQSTATSIYTSATDSAGMLVKLGFDDIFYVGATSAVKGYIKLTKLGDPSKWIRFRVTGYAWSGSYGQFSVAVAGTSSTNPLAPSDPVIMDCQRTGDKGDSGALTGIMHVRDQQASGTSGGTSPAAGAVTRTLNTVVRNTISGASLASNQVSLPAGTYRILASAPAMNVQNHSLRLIDASDSSIIAYGTTEYAVGSVQTRSLIALEVVFAASKTIYLQHYTAASAPTTGLGQGISAGLCVFSEMFIEKVS